MIHTKNNGAMCRSVISLRIAEIGLHSCQNKIKLSHVPSAHPRFNNAATKKQSGNVCWPPISYILVFWGGALLIVMVQTCIRQEWIYQPWCSQEREENLKMLELVKKNELLAWYIFVNRPFFACIPNLWKVEFIIYFD